MYRNPFYLGWNKGWSFLFFLEGGIAKIEAKGFGISITTKVKKGESPLESADRLVSKEQRIRKSRYYSWVKSINEKTIKHTRSKVITASPALVRVNCIKLIILNNLKTRIIKKRKAAIYNCRFFIIY